MAGNDEQFNVWLKTHFDGDALAAARRAFDQTKKGAKDTDDALKDLGLTAGDLKSTLLSFVAVDAVWEQFKEGFEQVAALEQAMNQLERATKRNGDNFDVVRGKIVGMADALKKSAGVDDDLAIKKMAELYNATGDVANSMALVALATDVAVGAGMDLEHATDLVTRAAMGQTRGLKELAISIEETDDKTKNANKALDAIRKNFGGAAKDAKGLKVEVNRLSEAWEDFRNDIVQKASPGLELLIKLIRSVLAYMGAAFDSMAASGSRALDIVTGTARGIWEGIKGNTASAIAEWEHVKALSNTNASEVARIAADLKKKLDDIWNPKSAIPDAGEPGDIVDDGGGDSALAKELSEWEKEINRWNIMQGEIQKKLLDDALAAEKKFEASKLAMRKLGAKETERIEKELDRERERLAANQTLRIRDEVLEEKEALKNRLRMAGIYANAAVDVAAAVFGNKKEIAIAGAVVDTYRAAVEVLPNYYLMAAVIASGLAQVAKIASTEPASGGDVTRGAGFDVPMYDAAAVAGGRRWALDMVGSFSSGARAGWAEGMGSFGGGSRGMTDNSKTYNFNFYGGGFADPAIMSDAKKLKRRIDVVDRTIDSQRTVARNRRS